MDLKPINPFYQHGVVEVPRTYRLRATTYSYPFTWIEPVTDRTQRDVEHAKTVLNMSWDEMGSEQRESFLSGLKGCLNRKDLERIENNIQILLDVLEIDSSTFVGAIPEFPSTTYFEHMGRNVEAIRTAQAVHVDTPNTPQLPFNTWQKWNDIEKILSDAYAVVLSQLNYYAGTEIYAGDTVGLLL